MSIENLLKSNIVVMLGVGVAAAVLIPIALPAVARAAKPFAKGLVKSGLIVYEKGREVAAELGEVMEDVVAEARAEIEQEHAAVATAAPIVSGEPKPPTTAA